MPPVGSRSGSRSSPAAPPAASRPTTSRSIRGWSASRSRASATGAGHATPLRSGRLQGRALRPMLSGGTRAEIARTGADRRGARASRSSRSRAPSAGRSRSSAVASCWRCGVLLTAFPPTARSVASGTRSSRASAALDRRAAAPSSTWAAGSPCRARWRSCRCCSPCRHPWRPPSWSSRSWWPILPDVAARRAARRVACVRFLGSAWFAVGPAAVLCRRAGRDSRRRRPRCVLLAALAAQIACDFGAAAAMPRLRRRASGCASSSTESWVYAVDLALTPVGLARRLARRARCRWAPC